MIIWKHQTEDTQISCAYTHPEDLLNHNDEYYEDFAFNLPKCSLHTVGLRKCSPNYKMLSKCVPECVFHFILSGEGWCNGLPFHAGDILFFNANISYTFLNDSENPCTYAWLKFKLEKNFLEQLGLSDGFKIYQSPNIHAIYSELYDMLYISHPEQADFVRLEASFFKVLSLCACPAENAPDISEFGKNISAVTSMALRFISNHYNNPNLKSSDIAEYVNFSEDYFRHIFRKETGFPVKQYITKIRIDNAKSLLIHSDYPINEIVEYCGFSGKKNFYELFRKATGSAPMEYRIRKRKTLH